MKEKGQSLVEMAVMTPLLIFILIGVLEVGWVLRGYLILVTANREATRFAVRPKYIDSRNPDWNVVRNQAINSISEMLPIDFNKKGTLKTSLILVNTTNLITYTPPLAPISPTLVMTPTQEEIDEFNRLAAIYEVEYPKYLIDLATYNLGYTDICSKTFGSVISTPINTHIFTKNFGEYKESHFDYQDLGNKLAHQNGVECCYNVTKGAVAKPTDGYMIIEMWYDQPQLFGFPLISNPFTDPIPLYTYTIMRYYDSMRKTGKLVEPFN